MYMIQKNKNYTINQTTRVSISLLAKKKKKENLSSPTSFLHHQPIYP